MEFVDLGLSVNWASCNLGAESPAEYGCYCLWNEIKSSKNIFTILKESATKLIITRKKFALNNDNIDCKSYRLPTFLEFRELLNRCKWIWTDYDGVKGYKVIGKNENFIFIPVGGSKDKIFSNFKESGYYWSSTTLSSRDTLAYALFFDSNIKTITPNNCKLGHAVRLVKD